MQGRIFSGLKQMEDLRRGEPLFGADARFSVRETWDDSVLCLVREQEQGKLVGIFNFHDYERIAWIDETDGMYQDMMTGEMLRASAVRVDGHGSVSYTHLRLRIREMVPWRLKRCRAPAWISFMGTMTGYSFTAGMPWSGTGSGQRYPTAPM